MKRRRSATLLLLAALAATHAGGRSGTWASFSAATSNGGSSLSSAPDWTAPTASASNIVKSAGGTAAFIKQGGSYYVYASASDTGNPASGVSTVTADVSTITTGQTAAALTTAPCPCSVGGATYSHRSALLSANASLPAGSKSYTLTMTDVAGNRQTQSGFSVTVDNTAPSATNVQSANGGATAGRPELGDTVTLTYSEQIDPASILSTWSGTSTPVVVRITNAGGTSNDVLTVFNSTNTSQLPLGSVNLGQKGLVPKGGSITFGATGTSSTIVQSGAAVTVTLGTPSATASTGAAAQMTWTPSTSATDRAGNANTSASALESGASDLDF